jgi:hypothetical protein
MRHSLTHEIAMCKYSNFTSKLNSYISFPTVMKLFEWWTTAATLKDAAAWNAFPPTQKVTTQLYRRFWKGEQGS